VSAYKLVRASEAPDFTGGAPVGAYLGYGRPLGAEQIAFNVRILAPGAVHVPPGTDPASGHNHTTIEEIYFVIDGEITMKIADDVVTLKARDAVLVPPESPRAFRNDSDEEAVVAMCSVRVEDPHSESRWYEGFWPAHRARSGAPGAPV
jgi:mannose-6-phosphate isomerase-like protein (cupin superfamily)